jgi:hypothetical protein
MRTYYTAIRRHCANQDRKSLIQQRNRNQRGRLGPGARCERWRDAVETDGLDYEKLRLVREASTRRDVSAPVIGHILLSRFVNGMTRHIADVPERMEDQ